MLYEYHKSFSAYYITDFPHKSEGQTIPIVTHLLETAYCVQWCRLFVDSFHATFPKTNIALANYQDV
ncbi:Uncharacterised protein [Enterobacter cloacae]|nr:Uncharacterised protein [Enterobacter cloacae]